MENYLLNCHTTSLRDQEVGEEDGNELPGTKEDVDAELQGAQHVQESCSTPSEYSNSHFNHPQAQHDSQNHISYRQDSQDKVRLL